MTEVKFNCAGCGQPLEAPVEMAGQVIECPACQQALTIPAPPSPVEESAAAPVQEEAGKTCPNCGAEMAGEAVLCVQCGFHTGLGKKIETELS